MPGKRHCDHAVNVSRSGAESDQREHVQAAIYERRPAALKERPAAPEDNRRGKKQFDPANRAR